MTQAAVGTLAPVVKVGGSELAAATLSSMIGLRVTSGLRLPSRATLEFLDDGFSVSAANTFSLGASIEITSASSDPLFIGEVTGVELDVERGAPNITVVADDLSYRMTIGNKTATYAQMSYSDIVSSVVEGYALQKSITPTSDVQEYVLQADSDFGFISEIADLIGYDWWVDNSGVFQFHPMGSKGDVTATVGWSDVDGSLLRFSVRASALHPKEVQVDGWDPDGQQAVTGSTREVASKPDAQILAPFLSASTVQGAGKALTSYHAVSKQADATALAKSVLARTQASAVVATGECIVNPKIVVGHAVGVSNMGPASGSYAVTQVEHFYSAAGFTTTFTAGDRAPSALVDTLAAPMQSSFRKDALVIGIVTSVGAGDAPKGYVKVKFPTLGQNVESAYARVVSMGAGDSRGMTFLPEVNDEVIVGFEGGDVTRPLVLGGLYSGRKAALEYGAQDGKVAKRQIVSRLGHVIELGDGDGPADQHIWLVLAGGNFAVKLGKDGLSATVPAGKPVSISSGSTKIDFDDSGNIKVAGKEITLSADSAVTIEGANIKLKAKGNIEASGAVVKLAANGQAELSSGGVTAVKGSVVKIN